MAGLQASGETLWALLEDDGYIPQDLKLILQVTKFDNLYALSCFDLEKDTKGIESFMQNTLHTLIPPSECQEYYDIFKNQPHNFILVGGHRVALKLLVEKCKAIITSNKKRLSTNVDNGSNTSRTSSSKKSKVSNPGPSEKDVCDAKVVLQNSLKNYIGAHYPALKDTEIACIVAKDGFDSLVAEAKCPVKECTETRKVTKNASRWNTSDFYAHVKTHFATRSNKKSLKNPTTIDSIFKPLGGKSNRDKRTAATETATSDDEDIPIEINVSEDSDNEGENSRHSSDEQNGDFFSITATGSNAKSSETVTLTGSTSKSNGRGKSKGKRTATISSDEEDNTSAVSDSEIPIGNEGKDSTNPNDRRNNEDPSSIKSF